MALDPVVATHLANESRKQDLRAKVARLRGTVDALASQAQAIGVQSSDTQQMLSNAQSELASLEQGSGPGVTDDFGQYSSLEQQMQDERFAGKAAAVAFVKANPGCSEEEALGAYRGAALSIRPADRKWLLQDPASLRKEYAAELVERQLIPDPSWESHREWILSHG